MESKEVDHLSALKRDEGPEGYMSPTSLGRLTQRMKQVRTRWDVSEKRIDVLSS